MFLQFIGSTKYAAITDSERTTLPLNPDDIPSIATLHSEYNIRNISLTAQAAVPGGENGVVSMNIF